MCTGFELATLFVAVGSTIVGSATAKRGRRAVQQSAQVQSQALRSLIPSAPTGPTASELEAQKQAKIAADAKTAADKRQSDIEAGIAADTATIAANRRRSLVGLAATVKTSARGLTGSAPVEKKTLLGQGGAF